MGHAQEPLQGVTPPFTLGRGPVQKLVAFGPA